MIVELLQGKTVAFFFRLSFFSFLQPVRDLFDTF